MVAVIGSRKFKSKAQEWMVRQRVEAFIYKLPPGTVIITGGAEGVDTIVEQAALKFGYVLGVNLKVIKPNYSWGNPKLAPLIRNSKIVFLCDKLVAFQHGLSRGTQDAITKAKNAGREVEVFDITDWK